MLAYFCRFLSIMILFCNPSAVIADGVFQVELSDWNKLLNNENWQVLLSPPGPDSLGVFIDNTKDFDLTNSLPHGESFQPKSLRACGINLFHITRTEFNSPFVPDAIVISNSSSIRMSNQIFELFENNQNLGSIIFELKNKRWVRLLTSDTTSALYSSILWSDPNARAAVIQCVTEGGSLVVESKLVANFTAQFFDKSKTIMDISDLDLDINRSSILNNGIKYPPYNIDGNDVTLARRRGVCVTSFIFFTNPKGDAGTEQC